MNRTRKSSLMTVYNKARTAARNGKGGLEIGRVNRAFGIMQHGGTSKINPEYRASMESCRCPDAGRGNVCKHRIACMMEFRITYPLAPLASTTDGRLWVAEQFHGFYNVHLFDTSACFQNWKQSAKGALVLIHKASGRRNHTVEHWEADYTLPIMPPIMTIYQMLESELGE